VAGALDERLIISVALRAKLIYEQPVAQRGGLLLPVDKVSGLSSFTGTCSVSKKNDTKWVLKAI